MSAMEYPKPLNDGYQWFRMDKKSPEGHLNTSAQQIVAKMRKNAAKKANQAWEQVHELSRMIERQELRGQSATEAYVECALVAFQMGDCMRAVELLDSALLLCNFHRHHYAAIQWMRGYLLWGIADRHQEALSAWQKAADTFESLYKFPVLPEADADWYRQRHHETSELLRVTIDQDGRNLFPQQTSPTGNGAATEKPPSPQQPKTVRSDRLRAYRVAGPIPAGSPRPVHWTSFHVEIERVLIDDVSHSVVSLTNDRIVNLLGDKRRYFLQVKGDSMNDARPTPINDGDYVLLISQPDAEDNDIVFAEIVNVDAEATLKRFKMRGDRIALQPESTNPANREYEFRQADQGFAIRGVVKAVFKKVEEPS